jgi:long-subunit fatty acid transport protein
MKKLVYVLIFVVFSTQITFAGGIMTNTNQSAAWVRMLVRDASLGIDAVYYNPAGLTFLEDGFFLSLNNQSLVQNRLVTSDYTHLHNTDFEGSVSAPVFPSLYTGYKTGKFVFSLGVNVIGGGGSATYDDGLPSIEISPSELVPGLASFAALGLVVNDYSLESMFEGSSIYTGIQFGASYQINEMFSAYLGARFVMAKNTYQGYLRNIMVNYTNQATGVTSDVRADVFMTTIGAPALDGVATQLAGTATMMDPLIAGGAGTLTIAQAEGMGIIDAATAAALSGGLTGIGQDPTVLTIAEAQGAFSAASAGYAANADALEAKSYFLKDQEADVEQSGNGFSPIIGINIKPNEKLNIGIKYEFKTNLELEYKTPAGNDFETGIDDSGSIISMFPDGKKVHQDMPALLSLGVDYKVTDKFSAQFGFHHYWDKSADYGKTQTTGYYNTGSAITTPVSNDDIIESNLVEWALGLEYRINDKFLASVGYLGTKTGVKEDYNTDLSFSNSSMTIGGGFEYTLNENIAFNIGFASTSYPDQEKTFTRVDPSNPTGTPITIKETYGKDNIFFGIGVDFKF